LALAEQLEKMEMKESEGGKEGNREVAAVVQ